MAKNSTQIIYVLHGWTKDTGKWRPFLNLLKKARLKTQLLPIPGLTSALTKPWNLNDYSNWFGQQTANQNQLTIIGHSFGGRIAIRYAVKNPGKVKKLILIDSAGIRPSSPAARLKRISFWTLAKLGKKITQNPQARKFLYQLAREKDYHNADTNLAKTMVNVIQDDQKQEIPYVKAHTLIIWGSNDKTTPLSHGRFMSHHITGSSLKIIDGAGHSPQYTHHQQTAQHIIEFLTKTPKK